MKDSVKTLVAVAFATVSFAVAAGTYYVNRPTDLDEFSDVGEVFYPDFKDPNTATGLQVVSYQSETGKTEKFKVEVKNGHWIIPTHHDYPADAKDRLAKTASSMIGVVRQALVERTKAAHKKYRLVDPLDANASSEGRGDRVTLYQGNEPIVDFIVGQKVENSNNLFYVRRADEDRFYRADLGNLEVSAKFSDWITKDVLEIDQNQVKDILITRYHIDEQKGRLVQDGKTELKREDKNEPWNLTDLDAEKEKVNVSAVGTLLNSLDKLEIVGVRPKPAGLSAGLKGDGAAITVNRLVQMDMASKGVFLSQNGDFLYNEGHVNIGLNNGVMFELGFGEEFSGNEFDIEVGHAPPTTEEEAEKLAQQIKNDSVLNELTDGAESEKKPGTTLSRYLFVTAFFDSALLGPEPVEPVKPTPPVEDAAQTTAETGDAEPPATESGSAQKTPAQIEHDKAMEEYSIQQEVYELKRKEYDRLLKSGEERVGELNRRFADWYYVISDESFKQLKLNRQMLVEESSADSNEESSGLGHPLMNSETPAANTPAEVSGESTSAPEKTAEPQAEMQPESTPESNEMPAEEAKPVPHEDPVAPAESEPASAESMEAAPSEVEPANTEPANTEPASTEPENPEPQPEAASDEVQESPEQG